METFKTSVLGNNKRRYHLHAFTGKVESLQKSSETHVSSSGGGGLLVGGSGYVNEANVRSTVINKDHIVLDDNGEKQAYELWNMGLIASPGHEVTVIWSIEEGNSRGPFILAYNHATKSPYINREPLWNMFVPKFGFATAGNANVTAFLDKVQKHFDEFKRNGSQLADGPIFYSYAAHEDLQPGSKRKVIAILLLFVLLHRFYTGHTKIGILQWVVGLLTLGFGSFIWMAIDLYKIITGSFRDSNGNPLV